MLASIVLTERDSCIPSVWDAYDLVAAIQSCTSLEQVAKLSICSGRQKQTLDQLFEITCHEDANRPLTWKVQRLVLNGLGANLSSGTMEVFGDVGDDVGQDAVGGRILVHGNAGDFAGAGMRSGTLVIEGNAKDHLGAISARSGKALRGGDIFVAGNAGDFVGHKMRRGIIYIGTNAGASGAHRMIAGTIVVRKQIGQNWAGEMKRGSVILGEIATQQWQAHLTEGHPFELSFLPILWKYLQSQVTSQHFQFPVSRWATRQIGDLSCNGKGEVLTLTRI